MSPQERFLRDTPVKLMKSLKSLLLLAALFMTVPAHGQVVLQDTYAVTASSGPATDLGGGTFGYEFDLASEFSAAGHGKLVMVYGGHDGNVGGLGSVPTVTSVTYAGTELIEAIQETDNGGIVTAAIFYLDNVVTDGILRIELDSGTTVQSGFGLYAVDGLKVGVQDTGSALSAFETTATLPVTFTTDEGFFVQEFARNNQTVTDDTGDAYELLYNISAESYRGYSQYRLIDAPGEYVAPIGNGGVNFRKIVTAAFEADTGPPPPSVDPKITSITSVGSDTWELTLTGDANAGYAFYSSPALDFTPGTLIENLTQGDPGDAGAVGGTNDSVLTTDGSGDGKVRVTLSGSSADFVRAQTVP